MLYLDSFSLSVLFQSYFNLDDVTNFLFKNWNISSTRGKDICTVIREVTRLLLYDLSCMFKANSFCPCPHNRHSEGVPGRIKQVDGCIYQHTVICVLSVLYFSWGAEIVQERVLILRVYILHSSHQ